MRKYKTETSGIKNRRTGGRFAAVVAFAIMLAPSAALASPVGKGSFEGATGHTTSGSVTVTEQDGRYVIELGGDFVLDGAPDPYVALGKGSALVRGGLIDVLGANTGKQRYAVEVSPALEDATQVLIWCKKYSVPIGVAPID